MNACAQSLRVVREGKQIMFVIPGVKSFFVHGGDSEIYVVYPYPNVFPVIDVD
jgi:hypothetical protein